MKIGNGERHAVSTDDQVGVRLVRSAVNSVGGELLGAAVIGDVVVELVLVLRVRVERAGACSMIF